MKLLFANFAITSALVGLGFSREDHFNQILYSFIMIVQPSHNSSLFLIFESFKANKQNVAPNATKALYLKGYTFFRLFDIIFVYLQCIFLLFLLLELSYLLTNMLFVYFKLGHLQVGLPGLTVRLQ